MKTITILGSTGSIGTQALEVANKHKIKVKALAAYSNTELLAKQAIENDVDYACIYSKEKVGNLKDLLKNTKIQILEGMSGLKEIASLNDVDCMLNSVVGMVGLLPTLTAIEHGTDIALANKETLVAGGELVIKAARKNNVNIYPVDSEHSAIFQCLQGIKNLVIKLFTASRPFYGKRKKDLAFDTKQDALKHPIGVWSKDNN